MTEEIRFLSLHQVLHLICLARSTLYELISRGLASAPVQISDRRVGWIQSEIQEFMLWRIAATRKKDAVRPKKNVVRPKKSAVRPKKEVVHQKKNVEQPSPRE